MDCIREDIIGKPLLYRAFHAVGSVECSTAVSAVRNAAMAFSAENVEDFGL
jgi:hypothetical protein